MGPYTLCRHPVFSLNINLSKKTRSSAANCRISSLQSRRSSSERPKEILRHSLYVHFLLLGVLEIDFVQLPFRAPEQLTEERLSHLDEQFAELTTIEEVWTFFESVGNDGSASRAALVKPLKRDIKCQDEIVELGNTIPTKLVLSEKHLCT